MWNHIAEKGDDIDMGLSSMHLWVETVRKKDTGKDKTRKKDKSGAGKTPEKKEGATEAGEGRGAERGEAGEGRGERRSEEEGIRLQAVLTATSPQIRAPLDWRASQSVVPQEGILWTGRHGAGRDARTAATTPTS